MRPLEQLFRPGVRELKPYRSARDEYSGPAAVFLDANENCFGSPLGAGYGRYPDPHHLRLRRRLADLKGVPEERIFVGHGSDEAIDLLIRAFCRPGRDAVVIVEPTYGMYAVSATAWGAPLRRARLGNEFALDAEAVLAAADSSAKMVFLCSPNNPTGNLLDRTQVERLIAGFDGIVVLDEAYIDFSEDPGFVSARPPRRNLVVLQTLSKAWGLAGLRVGMAFADPEVIRVLNLLKAPYNLSVAAQDLALRALARVDRKDETVRAIKAQRSCLEQELARSPAVERVFPSQANFLLARMRDAARARQALLERGIVVRDRSDAPLCENCLRITVGLPDENRMLLEALAEFSGAAAAAPPAAGRVGSARRATHETVICARCDLDGAGRAQIRTGLGFFDHMLEQIARHGRFDLFLEAGGDLWVDEHHTIEDTGLALGEAFLRALGDKRGLERFGFTAPLDEALASVAVDLSGRPWLEWKVKFDRERLGDVPTEMFEHFFRSFSDAARCTIHISADARNDHHRIEAVFKAFGRALGAAARKCGDGELPTTKGAL